MTRLCLLALVVAAAVDMEGPKVWVVHDFGGVM
jgi:hypothetical protein